MVKIIVLSFFPPWLYLKNSSTHLNSILPFTVLYELKLFCEVLQKNKLENSCLHPLAVAFNCVISWKGLFASFKGFYFVEAELIDFLIRDFYHFQIRHNPKETHPTLKPLFCQERAK